MSNYCNVVLTYILLTINRIFFTLKGYFNILPSVLLFVCLWDFVIVVVVIWGLFICLFFTTVFPQFLRSSWSWKDVSVVVIIGCSFKGPGFNSQHLHAGFQPPVTPIPEDLMPLLAFVGTKCTHAAKRDIHAEKTSTHKMKVK